MTNDEQTAAPALLKDILGPQAIAVIADAGVASSPHFNRKAFLDAAAAGLEMLSIMERVRHIAEALAKALPDEYQASVEIIRAMAPRLSHGFQAVAVTEYVARYGLDHFEDSMAALADLTRFGTAEFAIRPFLARDAERTLARMRHWCDSKDEHIRRLASEGCRPRLPWAARVPALKNCPTLAAPILEVLKADESAYVRKSVANHLNDIAKDRPDWLLARLDGWSQGNIHTKWIIRHALRTLIKAGEPRALRLIGVEHGATVDILQFSVAPSRVRLGDHIAITAKLRSTTEEVQRLVIDYRLHYVRAGGKTTSKVFKLRTLDAAGGETVTLGTRQMIRDFSTRRHYAGNHILELIVNGQTVARTNFLLLGLVAD